MESVGNKIFAAGNIHTDSATLYSIVLASDDSGKDLAGAARAAEGAAASTTSSSWISKTAGSAARSLQPLPQDPFFLITSDGGKTWRQRPLFRREPRGAILQFWFSSRSNGSLVIDRGREPGSTSFTKRPTAATRGCCAKSTRSRCGCKRAAGGNPDWRIRADKANPVVPDRAAAGGEVGCLELVRGGAAGMQTGSRRGAATSGTGTRKLASGGAVRAARPGEHRQRAAQPH